MIRLDLSTPKHICILSCLFLLSLPTYLLAECQLTLQWSSSEPEPDGYRLYERVADSPSFSDEYYDIGKETNCTISNLEENTTYYFAIRAYAGDTESDYSNEIAFTCDDPEASPVDSKETMDENAPVVYDHPSKDPVDGQSNTASNDLNPPSTPSTVSPENKSPDVSLNPILTASEYHDQDPGDAHTETRWKIFRTDSSECIYDITSSSALTTLQVPPSTLEPFTAYYWTVTYYSQSGGVSEPAPTCDFTTSDKTISTPAQLDAGSSGGGASSGGGGNSSGDGGTSDGLFGVGCFIQQLF